MSWTLTQPSKSALLEMRIPEARQWWPVDYGQPHLYRMSLSFSPNQGSADFKSFTFGVRTIEMSPLPDGPDLGTYNWTFVVNGKPVFIKGANWCTVDALLQFDRERYDRFLRLARDSHMQLLRAWGSGMPETDEFYDLCRSLWRHGLAGMAHRLEQPSHPTVRYPGRDRAP